MLIAEKWFNIMPENKENTDILEFQNNKIKEKLDRELMLIVDATGIAFHLFNDKKNKFCQMSTPGYY